MRFLTARKRKWIVSYDLEIDGTKIEDEERTITALNAVEAVTTAMSEIYEVASLQASNTAEIRCDIWDVCEVEE